MLITIFLSCSVYSFNLTFNPLTEKDASFYLPLSGCILTIGMIIYPKEALKPP